MQNVFAAVGGCVLFAAGVFVGTAPQDEKKAPTAAASEQDGAMAALKPTAEHAYLAKLAGKWKAKMTMYGGPQPVTSTGVETVRMDLGGLWQVSDFVEDKGGKFGGFAGHGLMGWDPTAKHYVGTWFDAWSYTPTNMKGTLDKTGKILTVDATGKDPSGAAMSMQMIHTDVDDKHRTFSMRIPGADGAGGFMEVMKIEYARE